MLIYHPAFDAHHCVFRLLAIIDRVVEIEIDKACILDFYLAFPSALTAVRWPPSASEARRTAKKHANPYRHPASPVTTFRSMRQLQEAALRCIAASRFIEEKHLEEGIILRTNHFLNDEMKEGVDEYLNRNEDISKLVLSSLIEIPLLGKDGLKDRTALMEYRYDVT